MIRFQTFLYAAVLACPAIASIPADAQTVPAQMQPGGIVPQAADGTKAPPPAMPQPGAVVGSAADAPAVAAQADGQPVITPGQGSPDRSGQQPSQAQAVPTPPAAAPSPAAVAAAPSSGSSMMPENPTRRTPEPPTIR
jgi:hypothetical protein